MCFLADEYGQRYGPGGWTQLEAAGRYVIDTAVVRITSPFFACSKMGEKKLR